MRVDVGSDNLVISGMTVADKDALIKWLQNELEERSKQIERLQEEIRRNQERSDTIILRLADELEAQRALFEGKKPRRKRDESLWQRLRRADGAQGRDVACAHALGLGMGARGWRGRWRLCRLGLAPNPGQQKQAQEQVKRGSELMSHVILSVWQTL